MHLFIVCNGLNSEIEGKATIKSTTCKREGQVNALCGWSKILFWLQEEKSGAWQPESVPRWPSHSHWTVAAGPGWWSSQAFFFLSKDLKPGWGKAMLSIHTLFVPMIALAVFLFCFGRRCKGFVLSAFLQLPVIGPFLCWQSGRKENVQRWVKFWILPMTNKYALERWKESFSSSSPALKSFAFLSQVLLLGLIYGASDYWLF